jgi:hypothetical protein
MPANTTQHVDRALLIGIDRYLYIEPNLSGCVGDVESVYKFLTERMGTPAGQIIRRTSPLDQAERPEELATRANIVAGFEELARLAKAGEQVYIQYSGHGMRNDSTLLPGIEPDGRDEAIAPMDSGYADPASCYLLDKELGWLIKRITDTGAFVTFVCDCCHSASATRNVPTVKIRKGQRKAGDTVGGRDWEGGDPRPRPDQTLVAPLAELKALVMAPDGTTGSLLPAPRNYVLITGCRERETSKEYLSNGVCTYFLLKLLEGDFSHLSYRSLVDQIGGSILQLAETDPGYGDQTPQLEGNGNLIVFGGGVEDQPPALVATPLAGGNIQLSVGSAVGLSVGTVVALYPPGTVDLDAPSTQLGVITLTSVDPDSAVGQLDGPGDAGSLPAGMCAVVVRPGSTTIRRRVAVGKVQGLDTLKEAIARAGAGQGSPYLVVVEPEQQEEFSVAVDNRTYRILDHRDQPLPRISPPIAVDEPGAAERMVRRLEHLVKYRNAWDLANDVDASTLGDKLAISVVRRMSRSAGRIALRPGESIDVVIHNRSNRPLSAALFYFGPDWSVRRIWPDGATTYEELAVTGDEGLKVWNATAELPAGVSSSIERLKLFATDRPTSFDAISLGPLDTARSMKRSTGGNALERMLTALGEGRATRELVPRRARSGDWGTAELELEISA